ncbi:Ig-like domain repeat protein [Streptomyces sp. NPDC005722]
MRTLPSATAIAVLFSSVALAVGTAGPARADSAKVLPITGFGDMVVDGVHQRVFISDPYTGKLVATDYAGTPLATLTGLAGVDGLALSADSGLLYAAVPGDDAIISVDTASVTQTARYATGEGTDPAHLALAGGKVWFGYGNKDHGDIGSLDVSGPDPVVALDQDPETDYPGAPRLASTPGVPGMLAAAAPEYYGSWIGVYDVSGGTATRTARAGGWSADIGSTADLALTPDGSRLITANPGDHHRVWQTSDLAEVAGYPTTYHPEAVAVAEDGTVAAGSSAPYDPGLYVFTAGTTSPVRQYVLPRTGTSSGYDVVDAGGMAWEPGGGRLFAVSGNYDSTHILHVYTDPTKSVPSITAGAPTSAPRGKPLTVKGKVTGTLPLPAGTPLSVTRTDLESPAGKSLPATAVKADGTYSFTDTPPAGGKVTYKVSYAGDATRTAASASWSLQVSRATPALTLNHAGSVYSYGADVSFTAHLGSTYKNRTVEIWADPYGGDKPNKLLRTAKVNASGNVSATVDMTRDTVVTAVFKGDARYAPRSVKVTSYAKVRVSTAVSKHYKTGRIGSTTYYWFHKNTDPVLTTTMSYYKNRKQRFELQVYYQGKWYSSGSQYFKLATNGKSAVRLGAPGEAGIRARMRSSYVNGSSGDNVNSTTYGSWKYLYFTK